MLPNHRLLTISVLMTLAVLLVQMPTQTARAAESKAPALSLDSGGAVVLNTGRNGMPAKTKLIPTASYDGYSLSPVVDGNKQRQEMEWVDAAWASEEDGSPHGIEIQLSQPRRGGRFQVTWAYDTNGDPNVQWWPSRNYVIQVKTTADAEWKTVIEVKNNQSVVGSYALPQTSFSFVRIYQTAGGGHEGRPNLMWVGQLELVD